MISAFLLWERCIESRAILRIGARGTSALIVWILSFPFISWLNVGCWEGKDDIKAVRNRYRCQESDKELKTWLKAFCRASRRLLRASNKARSSCNCYRICCSWKVLRSASTSPNLGKWIIAQKGSSQYVSSFLLRWIGCHCSWAL